MSVSDITLKSKGLPKKVYRKWPVKVLKFIRRIEDYCWDKGTKIIFENKKPDTKMCGELKLPSLILSHKKCRLERYIWNGKIVIYRYWCDGDCPTTISYVLAHEYSHLLQFVRHPMRAPASTEEILKEEIRCENASLRLIERACLPIDMSYIRRIHAESKKNREGELKSFKAGTLTLGDIEGNPYLVMERPKKLADPSLRPRKNRKKSS